MDIILEVFLPLTLLAAIGVYCHTFWLLMRNAKQEAEAEDYEQTEWWENV